MLTVVTGPADHVLRNRAVWDRWASSYAGPGLRSWSAAEPTWGIWGIPEAIAGVLPPGLDGADTIELGCGTGYVSAWLARRGARPVALDNSPGQLTTARELQDRFGLRFPLFHANAERRRSPTPASTWPSASTAPASGAIRTPGSPRRPGCCVPAVS
jgi:SAM-dependent methyltransferase